MTTRMSDNDWMDASNLAQQWWTPEHMGSRVVREAERARASELALTRSLEETNAEVQRLKRNTRDAQDYATKEAHARIAAEGREAKAMADYAVVLDILRVVTNALDATRGYPPEKCQVVREGCGSQKCIPCLVAAAYRVVHGSHPGAELLAKLEKEDASLRSALGQATRHCDENAHRSISPETRLNAPALTRELADDVETIAWIFGVAKARDCEPRAKVVNLKFTVRTLRGWLERANAALARIAAKAQAPR